MAHKRIKIAVFVSGRGSNLRALYQHRKQAPKSFPYDIAIVISDQYCPAFDFALEKGITTYNLHAKDRMIDKNSDHILCENDVLQDIDLIVLAGFMRIVRPNFITDWMGRIINIHPSLLPKFPGLNTHQRAIESEEKEHGCTVHFVDSGIDTGPIIAQKSVSIDASDNAKTLATKVLHKEHALFGPTIAAFAHSYLSSPELSLDQRIAEMQQHLDIDR